MISVIRIYLLYFYLEFPEVLSGIQLIAGNFSGHNSQVFKTNQPELLTMRFK